MYNAIEAFAAQLVSNGWNEVRKHIEYTKGTRILIFDTSSWVEVGTQANPRIFDVPVPAEHHLQWTLNLIEHLCNQDDAIRGDIAS